MFPVGVEALRVMFDTVLPVCTIETTDAYYRGLKIQNADWRKDTTVGNGLYFFHKF